MSCCCPERKSDDSHSVRQYDDLKSGASGAPTTQSMKRHAVGDSIPKKDDGSDVRAVDWWRTRSQDTNQSTPSAFVTPDRTSSSTTQPMQLTPEEEYSWAKGVGTSPQSTPEKRVHHSNNVTATCEGQQPQDRTATMESIEVDELSAVQEELKRREIQDFFPASSTVRAPSLPVDRSRTYDSTVSDESSLRFKLVEHEEEGGLRYNPSIDEFDEHDEEDLMVQSPAKMERRLDSNDDSQYANGGSRLRDLRHAKGPMVDREMADDYVAAADNSVDVDMDDELDQIVMGLGRPGAQRDAPNHREELDSGRMEDMLTGRTTRRSPVNPLDQSSGKQSVRYVASSAPGREPVSPKRSPTPEEAAAAAAAAASQIRAPSPLRGSNPTYHMGGTKATPRGFDASNGDSLSNVPSNVDSDTRDRYLMACRLLKATMIQKDSRLQPEDKEFLRELLSNAEQSRAPSEYDIAAVETASEILSDNTEDDILHIEEEQRFRVMNIKEAWQKKAKELFASRPHNTPGLILPEPLSPFRKKEAPPDSQRRLQMPALKDTTPPSPRSSPFVVLGRKPDVPNGVLTPPLMEALRGFVPYSKVEENFWLKYTLNENGGTLQSLLDRVQDCKHTVIAVETKDGNVFGAYCSSPWRVQATWFGSGECFLWRLKQSRLAGGGQIPNYEHDNEMEVYPYTGHDNQIQYCTERTLAVGGGEWSLANGVTDTSPHQDEPVGIAFMLDGDLMGGETNSCATFANPRLCGKESENEFDIFGLEVWTLTPCLTVADAQKLEEKRAFVEKNTVVRS